MEEVREGMKNEAEIYAKVVGEEGAKGCKKGDVNADQQKEKDVKNAGEAKTAIGGNDGGNGWAKGLRGKLR